MGAVQTVRERSYRYMGPKDYKKDDKSDSKFDAGDTVTYDSNGNEIERVMISDFGESMGKQTQTFDSVGLLKATVFADPKGAVRERSVYTYSAGKLTEVSLYDGRGVLREKTKRSYDPNGHLSEEVYFDPAAPRAKTIFSNDRNGNAVEMAFFLSNGTKANAPVGPCLGAHRITYTYNAKGQAVTKAVYETDGRVKKSWTFTYNDRGDQLQSTMKSGGHITTYEYKYEYDTARNWIKMMILSDSNDNFMELMLKATGGNATPEELKKAKADTKMTSVTTRKITYY